MINEIVDVHARSDGTYGAPRVHAQSRRNGHVLNHKRVERLMARNGICGVFKAAKVRTTIPAQDNPPVPDLVGRRFKPTRADLVWCGDITYIPTGEGWSYLASVLDLGSRRLLGYSMADHVRTELVGDALNMAVGARGGHATGVIFHGDRGSQYMSADYQRQLADLGMRQSVGRTGVCWDNAVAEALWSGLKRELVHRCRFATRTHARHDLQMDQLVQPATIALNTGLRQPEPVGNAVPSTTALQPRSTGRITKCPAKGGTPQLSMSWLTMIRPNRSNE